MKSTLLNAGSALEGVLFSGFLRDLAQVRELNQGECIGPWRICHELGRGGNGVVYLAERGDGAFSKQVALKWLRPDRPVPGAKRALERERELLAGLDHPNIARLIDGGQTDDGMLWFAMDYVPGVYIDQHGTGLALREQVELVRALCLAVHHAHSRGLIHGDIKPSNVLVDSRGRPRLLDFGIARVQGAGGGGSYGLTPDFASPEQKRGEVLTTASDVWQLGCLLEALLRGQRVPHDVAAVIARATATDLHSRYPSASAMESDLKAWLERRPVAARGGGLGYRAGRFLCRNLAMSALAAVAFTVIFTGALWFTWQLAEERDFARAALQETEAALARAESLREFLLGLFWAADPARPADQLPSTEALLALGARQALDQAIAPPAERLSMLLAIGEIYIYLGRNDDAEPLLEAAIELGYNHVEEWPQKLARALMLKSFAAREIEREEAYLLEAERLVKSLDEHWNLFAEIRAARSYLEYIKGEFDAALALAEPLYFQANERDDVNDETRSHILNFLAGYYEVTGNLRAGEEVREAAIKLAKTLEGEDSRNYAINISNGVDLKYNLGQYDKAEANAREAIAVLDQVYGKSVGVTSVTYGRLAFALLFAGRYEEALRTMEAAGESFAEVLGVDAEQWEILHLYKGVMLAKMGRWDDAAPGLLGTRDNFDRAHHSISHVTSLEGLLAIALCRKGQREAGRALLAELQSDNNGRFPGNPVQQAQLHEARATCLFEAGEPEAALREIELALETMTYPGRAMEVADREILRAQILMAMGRPGVAAESIRRAERLFTDIGLPDHPHLYRVSAARQTLFGNET